MAGSQLTQLKTALTSAGLNRKTHSKKDKKAFKKGGARETDRGKTLAKLEDIRKNLNKFDERETRVKHDVGGRNLKGVTGRPSASKQAGLEQRRKTLLPEHQLRGHTGTFRDRRFGESDPSMSLEDRMLERYTRERQRGQGKKGLFNIEDAEDGLDGFDEGTALGGLTHGGRNVLDLPGDDFEIQGLGGDEDDEDDREGRIARRTVGRAHFGGFEGGDEEDEDMPEKKKSKSEVMSEIIAKSKMYKVERQQQKDQDEDLREELDEDIDTLRELLEGGPAPAVRPAVSLPGPSRRPAAAGGEAEDGDYDQYVRSLAFEARAKPKDRTKTEEEVAIEEAEKLQKAEAKRLRRMRGEDVSDEESGEDGGYRKRRKTERRGEADDLDDDFEEDELLGPGITREQIEDMARKGSHEDGDSEEEEEEEEEEEDDEEEDNEDEEDEEEESDEASDEEVDEDLSMMDDLDDEAPELVPIDEDLEEAVVVRKAKGKGKATSGQSKEIPYTFACPTTIEEFEDIMEELDSAALPVVVQRIRAIHHPSLAQGNKEKLQDFFGVLLDYILILASQNPPSFSLISTLTPHLTALVKLNPLTASSHFISKISLMQNNLRKGLARGASYSDSKTFPGAPELVLLRLIGVIWSTSDYSHPVVIPAGLLAGQYLAQSRVRRTSDLASGLFLCSLLAQYEAFSKRLLPEPINFVASSLLALLPRRKDAVQVTTYPDILAPDVNIALAPSSTAPREPVDLVSALSGNDVEQTKVNLAAAALRSVQTFSTMYASNDAFIEVFTPILSILEGSRIAKLSDAMKGIHSETQNSLARMLNFARASRTPLAIQSHKPVPIRTFAPRFEEDFAPGRHYDPDVERNSTAKVKALYNKERKGAIRELRKDNKFLAGEKAREQSEKDREYKAKMRRVEGDINLERAEEKDMMREKQREKRRAGRK